jgi:para-nitrobenzyl esterase
VETTAGRLRGLRAGSIHQFKGVRYGGTTEGPFRFLPPQPLSAWTGVQNAASYGPSAPQHHNQMPGNFPTLPPPINDVYKWYWAADLPISEDCLSLNVFTPSVNDTAKRPVMVWLHGGGFANGSGTARGFDGTNLARDGDVVVVTVNHRLNILGHLFLATWVTNGLPMPATTGCSTSSQRWNGCAITSKALAATRTTSRSSASPAAVQKSPT